MEPVVHDEFADDLDEDWEEVEEAAEEASRSGTAELRRRIADRTPPTVRAARVRVSPRAAVGVLLVALLVAAGLVLAAWRSWPEDATPAGDVLPGRTATVAVSSSPAPDVSGTPVVVHVAGRVATPGLVTLPGGSRVGNALAAVGGPLPDADLDAVNLARVLVDGEQVLVPAPGQAAAGPAVASGSGDGGPLNLNAATAEQLDALPGVGEVLAGRIVAWREENGRFTSVDDLGEVTGIGPKLLDGVRDLVTV
ncbi:helix-hairpin-helix domain-containing protein [Kineococcus sp. GCM10028916]|uniref:helix-hairpin-helix domain-containing protein n=1 Tax=Kineococcus sp. GCM10028916 TaxID=3273394 RepID=UPI00362937FE